MALGQKMNGLMRVDAEIHSEATEAFLIDMWILTMSNMLRWSITTSAKLSGERVCWVGPDDEALPPSHEHSLRDGYYL
jgi:hypothetical protein